MMMIMTTFKCFFVVGLAQEGDPALQVLLQQFLKFKWKAMTVAVEVSVFVAFHPSGIGKSGWG